MTDVWGALGQAIPSAATLTDVYTVPASKWATVEAIACNRGAAATVRLSHAVAGASDADAQYLLFDAGIDAGETRATLRFTMGPGDVVRAYSTTGNVAFNINGIEE